MKERRCDDRGVKPAGVRTVIRVLYEDDRYIVFEKPSGLLVIPTPKGEQRTLVNIVNRQCAAQGASWKLHPCHRIDRDTSGAIIFAKGKRHQKYMMDLFRQRLVKKKYIAFIHGKMSSRSGEFRTSVQDIHQKKFQRKSPALSAVTLYKVLESKKLFSIVEVQPVTGRTNQIRIHFSQARHPLLGERKYAFARDYALKFRRTALHAFLIQWRDPVSHKDMVVSSELPKDMREFQAKN